MNKIKRLLRPIGIAVVVLGVMLALGFVERTADRAPITDLRIMVEGGEGMHFIDEAAVRREVLDQVVAVMGAPLVWRPFGMARPESRLRSVYRNESVPV